MSTETLTPDDIAAAKATVQAVLALESCPGWSWNLARSQKSLAALARRILTERSLRGQALDDVRTTFLAQYEYFTDLHRDFQKALRTLQQAKDLPDHLLPRLGEAPPEPPLPDAFESLNPFGTPTIKGTPPPPAAS